MLDQVVSLALTMGAGEENRALLEILCQAAMEELKGKLKTATEPQDCGSAFPVAAAWLALEGLEVAAGGTVESFTAGDMTVRTGKTSAAGLRQQAMRLMGPYFGETEFAFQGVRG